MALENGRSPIGSIQSGALQQTKAARSGINGGEPAVRRICSMMPARWLVAALALLLAIAAALPAARAETMATDKAALLVFKAAITAVSSLPHIA